jgi:hypothetical protein
VRLNGTFDIDYDDGESEQSVPRDLIKVKARSGSPTKLRLDDDVGRSSSANLDVGDAVEANFRGRGKFYSGKISRVRANGTYDIDYDDGEKEQMISRDLIKPTAG